MEDPYAHSPRVAPPRDRIRDPRDPREPYTKVYTNTSPPVTHPFPSTGSFDFRRGLYKYRPMTVKEQRFEQNANAWQAEHDVRVVVEEWERLKILEEKAIELWQELDGNLVEYQTQMRTRDQQETEFQCQRKKMKADTLLQIAFDSKLWEQEYLTAVVNGFMLSVAVSEGKPLSEELKAWISETFMNEAADRTIKAKAATSAQKRLSEESMAKIRRAYKEGVTGLAMEAKAVASAQKTPSKESEAMKRRAFKEAVAGKVMAEAATSAQKMLSEESKAVKRREFKEAVVGKAVKAGFTTLARQTPSEEPFALGGISSDLGGPDTDLESTGESSDTPSPERIGSADSDSGNLGRPSVPPQRQTYNTVRPPQRPLRRPLTLTQFSGNSSNSPSPPRSSSVDDSTPPSSQHSSPPSLNLSPPKTPPARSPFPETTIWSPLPTEMPTGTRPTPSYAPPPRIAKLSSSSSSPSRPQSLNLSPPKTPTASYFAPDPSIWGASNLPASSNHPSHTPSLTFFPQPPSPRPSPAQTPKVPFSHPYFTHIAKLSSIRFKHPPFDSISNANEPTQGQSVMYNLPTDGFLDGPLRTVEEPREKKVSRWGDAWSGVVGRGAAGGGFGRGV